MRYIFSILILFLLVTTVQAHIFYKWVDKDGIVNFTDDYSKIPLAYRDQVDVLYIHEKGSSPPVQKMRPQKGQEIRKDMFGRDETWWREKVRPWKKRLMDAEVNYERVHEKFMQKAMELSRRRFGTPTQYKANIIELDRFKEEMIKYQAQIAEVHEILGKLFKEAEASRADTDWLK